MAKNPQRNHAGLVQIQHSRMTAGGEIMEFQVVRPTTVTIQLKVHPNRHNVHGEIENSELRRLKSV
jgi:hypothetical protein